MERISNYSSSTIRRLITTLLYACLAMSLSGCAGTWVWQEDYPKHRTMSFKCPSWNYNEAYDELHHIYTTRQHEPVKVKK